MSTLKVGDIFPSMKEAKLSITTTLKDEGLSYQTISSKPMTFILKCKTAKDQTQGETSGCKFRIRCITSQLKSKGPVTSITQLQHHTCPPSTHYNFEGNSQVKYLIAHHSKSVATNRLITAAQIRNNEQMLYGNTISYLAAYRTKQAILEQFDGKEQDEFNKMGDLLGRMSIVDPGIYGSIKRGDDLRFDHFFIAPSATQKAFQYMRPFIAIDACHCTSRYKQTLHIAVGIDGNGNILPLAWGIYQGENLHNWTRFLRNFRQAFIPNYPELPYIITHKAHHLVLISDRQKGLRKALKAVFPLASHAYCCQHIAANVQSRYGIAAREAFWLVAYARTEVDYQNALGELRKISHHAAIYIRNIKPKYFATYAFPAPRYGHLTSNIAESLNGAWKDLRHLTPLRMLVEIWQKVMQTFADRRQRTTTTQLLPTIQKAFDKRLEKSRRYKAMASSPTKFLILGQEGKECIVDLKARTCTCMQFQEFGGPCSHAIMAARAAKIDPITLFLDYFKPVAWEIIYKSKWSHLSPFLTANLEIDDTLPPLIKRRQGRPKAKRIRKSVALQDRQNRCSNPWCRQKGHNKRSCQTIEVEEGVVIDHIQENSSGSSNEHRSSSQSDGVRETPEDRRIRLRINQEKRQKAKRRRQRALARGENVPRGRKKKGHKETDSSSALSSALSIYNGTTPPTLSEIEVDMEEGSISQNSDIARLDVEIADAIARGVTPDIVREHRERTALQAAAIAATIAAAEEERRKDPFQTPSPTQPLQTRKRQREQELEEAVEQTQNVIYEEADELVGVEEQSPLTLTLRSGKRRDRK